MTDATFQKQIINKYNLYNGLFMQLPYEKMANIGSLLPFMANAANQGLNDGKTPLEIIDHFFERYTDITDEHEKISILFKMIQYVERQVVLFDSIEDSAFETLMDEDITGLNKSIALLLAQGKKNEIISFLNNFSVRIVFTAHPTQFYPPAVQHIIHDLEYAMKKNDTQTIDILLQQLGQTPFLNREKPTPLDEAKSIIYYLRNVYYKTMGELVYGLTQYPQLKDAFDNDRLITLGFWPGGDRDGNPFVTYDVTMDVIDELRTSLIKCYYHEIKALRRRITFIGVSEQLESLSDMLYPLMFETQKYVDYKDILQILTDVRLSLVVKHHSLFLEDLDLLITRVKIFKTHFAHLDIRQESGIHEHVIEQIVAAAGWSEIPWSQCNDQERMDILLKNQEPLDLNNITDEITLETLKNVAQIKDIQRKNGLEGCHRYIISNSEDVWAVLNVYILFKASGYKDEEIKIDIVPLFETMKGMEAARDIMDRLYKLPIYANHLSRRENTQSIMLGFSDGTKDGGYLKANWEIYSTKEALTSVSRSNHIKAIFFDGRGGPPARGGGKTHKFYAAQGKQIANHEIQLTIQGQTITSMYGNDAQFRHNCEQLISAGLTNELLDLEEAHLNQKQRSLITELGKYSYQKYQELKDHPKFVPYLEHISTLKYYGNANIGSRPGKRGSKAKLEFSDLRAISFVGSWSQLKQNVPGYYGIGSAIQKLEAEGRIDEIKALYRESAFFKTLMLNSMMSMQKTFFELTAYLSRHKEYGDFWNILKEEFDLSLAMSLKISGYDTLMQEEQRSKDSIMMRDRIVLPLLIIQQYALQRIANGGDEDGVMGKMVTRSLFGNINASRNSA